MAAKMWEVLVFALVVVVGVVVVAVVVVVVCCVGGCHVVCVVWLFRRLPGCGCWLVELAAAGLLVLV